MRRARMDRMLLLLLSALLGVGVLVFSSAAFGFLARGAEHTSSVVFNHLALGIGLGLIALMIAAYVDYRRWRPLAPLLYVASVLLTASVFLPFVGMEHAGGLRWLKIAGFTFQPAEALKLAVIIASAAAFAMLRRDVASWKGLVWLGGILLFPSLILYFQPDIGTLGVICITAGIMYLAAGASWRYVLLLGTAGMVLAGLLFVTQEHVRERVGTFLDPSAHPQSKGYQIHQSLIAVGSGGVWGRGYGQGVQKFTYLPEPMGDSIFAVAAEEFGFAGASVIVLLYLLLALRGFVIGVRAPDMFGALLAIGIAAYFAAEAYINIASMLGMGPLTGMPLPFMSQGGSAMLISLAAAGILLNISRYSTK